MRSSLLSSTRRTAWSSGTRHSLLGSCCAISSPCEPSVPTQPQSTWQSSLWSSRLQPATLHNCWRAVPSCSPSFSPSICKRRRSGSSTCRRRGSGSSTCRRRGSGSSTTISGSSIASPARAESNFLSPRRQPSHQVPQRPSLQHCSRIVRASRLLPQQRTEGELHCLQG